MITNLSKEAKLLKIKAASADGTSTVTSDAVDTQDFSRVLIFTTIATANAGNYVKLQQSSDDGSADAYADLEGTKVIAAVSGDIVGVDLIKPQERYIKCVVTRGATTVLGEIFALCYGAQVLPVTQVSTTNVEIHASPDEGTA